MGRKGTSLCDITGLGLRQSFLYPNNNGIILRRSGHLGWGLHSFGEDSSLALSPILERYMKVSETAMHCQNSLFALPGDTARLISQSFFGYMKLYDRVLANEI